MVRAGRLLRGVLGACNVDVMLWPLAEGVFRGQFGEGGGDEIS